MDKGLIRCAGWQRRSRRDTSPGVLWGYLRVEGKGWDPRPAFPSPPVSLPRIDRELPTQLTQRFPHPNSHHLPSSPWHPALPLKIPTFHRAHRAHRATRHNPSALSTRRTEISRSSRTRRTTRMTGGRDARGIPSESWLYLLMHWLDMISVYSHAPCLMSGSSVSMQCVGQCLSKAPRQQTRPNAH